MVSIELAMPIWEKEAQKQGSDNPFLSIFLSVDVIFVFKIVLSALAILFAYNTISGERGWHTQTGVIQSDSEGGQSIWVGEHLNRYYKGLIDEVKVWNRPLTAAELDQSGQQPSAVSASGKLTTVWGALKTAHR